MNNKRTKGPMAEESLRNYFLSIGYYVVRGVKFKFRCFDVTDVDLWLYSRKTPLNRERACVDIKNKKTPQALERILWTKGLQNILKLDSCIVATTDSRPEIREFGRKNNVIILDGKFLSRLTNNARSHQDRLTEEEFLYELDSTSIGRLGGNWRGRYEESKSRLLYSLNFDGANAWLEDIRYALTQIASGIPSWRLLYITCSHFMLSMDYIHRELVSEDNDQRRLIIENGFRYGDSGKPVMEKVSRMAASLVGGITAQPGLADTLYIEIKKEANKLQANLLAEFFTKSLTGASIFEMARIFESEAFSPKINKPSLLSTQFQALLGVISDFFEIDRKKILI